MSARSNPKKSSRKLAQALVSATSRSQITIKPPPIEANPQLTRTYRFIAGSGATAPVTITTAQLLTACGVQATTAVLGRAVFAAVKVQRIRIWAPATNFTSGIIGTPVTVSVLWASSTNQFTSGLEMSDSSVSTAYPAFVSAKPPKQTLASFFQTNSGSAPLFTLTALVGSIVDVQVRLVMGDGTQVDGTPSTAVMVGATVGLNYFIPLDGHGGNLAPVSLTTA